MRGPDAAATLLADHLEAKVPDKVHELEERLELAPGTVELPGLYTAEDRPQLAIEEWPAVLVIPREAELTVVDVIEASTVYRVTYRLRVYLFARAQEFADTSRLRHRLMLAVREVLLGKLDLGDPDAAIDASRYRESYSDVDVDPRDQRSIAGAYAELSLILEETMTTDLLRQGPLTPEVTGEPLPHPALD